MSKECSCLTNLVVLEHVGDFGNTVASALVDHFEGSCPELMDKVVVETIARLVHVNVCHASRDVDPESDKILILAEAKITALALRITSALAAIIKEHQQKENKNASH